MSKLRLALSVREGEEVKVSIQRKPTFTVAGLMREAIESSECPETNQLPGVHRTSRHMAPETCMQTATRWSCGRPSREHRGWSMRRATPLTQPVATASRSLRVKPSPPPAYSYKLGMAYTASSALLPERYKSEGMERSHNRRVRRPASGGAHGITGCPSYQVICGCLT